MSPMWILLVLWAAMALTGLNLLRTVVRASAGYLRIALFGFVDHRGMVINWKAKRRLLNGVCGVAFPVVTTAAVCVSLILVGGLLAQIR
jgi:hypothetical protein